MTHFGLHRLAPLALVILVQLCFGSAVAEEDREVASRSSEESAAGSSKPVTFGPSGPDAGKVPSPELARAPESGRSPVKAEERLKRRAQERWAALIDRDFVAAYEYATPSFREIYGAGDFALRYGRDITWLGAEVVKIEPRSPTSAAVHVRVHYEIVEKPTMRDFKMHSIVEEPWIRVNEDWWFVPKS